MANPEDASAPQRRFSILTNWFGRERTQNLETSQEDFLSIRSMDERLLVNEADAGKTYKRVPAEYDHPIWRLGWTDGRSNQPPVVNEKLLEAHARIEWSQQMREAEEQVARSTHEIESLDRERKALESERDQIEVEYKEIGRQRTAHFQDFSRKQAWSYLLFGLVTLIADIPLSLRLVAAGFGVKTTKEVDGQSLSADDIVSVQFFEVVRHFWEAIVLALGIAFASIVIKYFFDIVVFRDRKLTEGHSRSAENELGSPEERWDAGNATEKRDRRLGSPRLVSSVSWVVVLLFVSTTICLGIFRYQIQPQVDKYERDTRFRELKLQRIDAKYDDLLPIYEGEEDAPIKARKQATDLVDAELGDAPPPDFKSGWGGPTFVLLTLLLPIATAICFSVAGKKLRNARLFETITSEVDELNGKLASITEDISNGEGELAASRATLELAKLPEAQDNLFQSFRYLYLHGYERGSKNVPETTEAKIGSVYELGVKYFQRLLSQRINSQR